MNEILEPVKLKQLSPPPTEWVVVLRDDGVYPCGMICYTILSEFPEVILPCGIVKKSKDNEQLLGKYKNKDICDTKASRANRKIHHKCNIFISKKE